MAPSSLEQQIDLWLLFILFILFILSKAVALG